MTSTGSSWDNKITTLPISLLKLGKESENNILGQFCTLDHNSMFWISNKLSWNNHNGIAKCLNLKQCFSIKQREPEMRDFMQI